MLSISLPFRTKSPPVVNAVKVEIYTWRFCPYCMRAKGLLDRKKVNYSEYAIDNDSTARALMAKRAGGKNTLPQIFINNHSVGGYDELYELEVSGQLDQLLGLGG